MTNKKDKVLGLDVNITRRDFLGATLVGSGTALLSPRLAGASTSNVDAWTGPGGIGDYATANGNTAAVRDAAHLIRDGMTSGLSKDAQDTGEVFDTVVVGGGFSGLGAAFEFQRHAPGKSCLLLDNHSIFGGEARQNEFEVDGYRLWGPQGSNGFMPPVGISTLSDEVWKEVGMPYDYEYMDQTSPVKGIRTAWDSYDAMYWGEKNVDMAHHFGEKGWVRNIWDDNLKRVPWDDQLKADMLRAFKGKDTYHNKEGLEAWLDTMTYKAYLEDVMGLDPRVTEYLDPIVATADFGLCSDVVSAYGAYLIQMPGMAGYVGGDSYDFDEIKIMSFPGGNTTYARRIVQHLVPDSIGNDDSFEQTANGKVHFRRLDKSGEATRIRLNATAFDVQHNIDHVVVRYVVGNKA